MWPQIKAEFKKVLTLRSRMERAGCSADLITRVFKGNRGRVLCIASVIVAVVLLIRFDPQHRGIRPWLDPQPILSVATLVIGLVVLSWQLHAQHRNTLEANRRQAENNLKLSIYGKIAERIEATGVPLMEVALLPTAFVGELIVRGSVSSARDTVPKSRYFAQLQITHEAASRSIRALMSILETHTIVMPEFALFRRRLDEALSGVNVAVNDFSQAAFQFAGSPDMAPIRWPPSKDDSTMLSGLASSAQWAGVSLTGVVSDLQVEAQNYLLGDLFPGRRVPPRIPGDPSVKVTTLPPPASA